MNFAPFNDLPFNDLPAERFGVSFAGDSRLEIIAASALRKLLRRPGVRLVYAIEVSMFPLGGQIPAE
jgi:hypothetical protein